MLGLVCLFIKRFLLVIYSICFIISLGWLFKGEIFKIIGVNNEVIENELLELQIPRIKLYRKVYNIGSNLNNVDYNVEILDSSNIGDNLYFLAAHSGSGDSSYFENLVYLDKGDLVYLKYLDFSYVFVVDDMFYIKKSGYLNINDFYNTLFLITCSLEYVDRQLVVRCIFIGVK